MNFNLKLAFRNLHKNWVYSALIIGGFAIAFSATKLIGLFHYNEMRVNQDFINHKQIYRLYNAKNHNFHINYDLFPILLDNYPEIKDACPMDFMAGSEFTLKNEVAKTSTQINQVMSTTNNFFDIFSVEVIQSIGSKPFDGQESIVLTEPIAKALFGAQNPLGQRVSMSNFHGNVTAIIKELPANSSFKAGVILNSENPHYRMVMVCDGSGCRNQTNHYLQLNKDTAPAIFTEKLNSTIGAVGMNVDSVGLQNLADIYLSTLPAIDNHQKGSPTLLRIYMVIALLIIFLASINYFNYSISVRFSKLKEIGITKTNGASWMHLINYSFTEVSLGILIAVIVSFLITALSLPFSETLFGKALQLSWQDFLSQAPIYAVVLIVVIIINSLGPIYILSRFKITEFLSGFGTRNNKQIGKQVTLTFQLAVSIALMAIVMIVVKQLQHTKHAELGFDKELLMRIDVPYTIREKAISLKQEINKLPFVIESALSNGGPGNISMGVQANHNDKAFTVNCISIDEDYIQTMGIKRLVGREFHQGDNNKVCLLNEAAIKHFEYDNIEGKSFAVGSQEYQIIGITNNFHVHSLHSLIEPVALIYDPENVGGTLSVRFSHHNVRDFVRQIEQLLKSYVPDEPLKYTFYDEQFQAMYAKEERLANSITFFSLIAITLTCMGILGHIFMTCLKKTKEIGIRKVNGAKIWEVMKLLNQDFVKWVTIAFIIATPIAWYAMNKWLENFAYKTELSWWIFALAGVLALGIALLTVSWQSWRAATRNPVEALRYE